MFITSVVLAASVAGTGVGAVVNEPVCTAESVVVTPAWIERVPAVYRIEDPWIEIISPARDVPTVVGPWVERRVIREAYDETIIVEPERTIPGEHHEAVYGPRPWIVDVPAVTRTLYEHRQQSTGNLRWEEQGWNPGGGWEPTGATKVVVDVPEQGHYGEAPLITPAYDDDPTVIPAVTRVIHHDAIVDLIEHGPVTTWERVPAVTRAHPEKTVLVSEARTIRHPEVRATTTECATAAEASRSVIQVSADPGAGDPYAGTLAQTGASNPAQAGLVAALLALLGGGLLAARRLVRRVAR